MSLRRSLYQAFSFGLVSLAMAGCEPVQITKTEYSELMHEKGRVVDTMHSNGYHDSKTNISPTMDFDGNIGMAITEVKIDVPETWGVVFRCEHDNKFPIQGSKAKYKVLWEKLDPGMEVIIDYKEEYRNIYEDIDGDGVRDLIESKLVDYDFIDANPVTSK